MTMRCVFGLLAMCLLAGCGGPAGPSHYEVSGTVTYDGRPVPAGYILFSPDSSAGNSGPSTQAEIKDGKYLTLPGKGTVGGPHVATISGFDGKAYDAGPIRNPMGQPMFMNHQIKVDLPRSPGVQDFTVPATK